MKNYVLIRISLAGVLIGLLFPICAWIIGISTSGLPLHLASLAAIHDANFIHYFVDAAPLILGSVFYFLGRAYFAVYQDKNLSTKEFDVSSTLTRNDLLKLMEMSLVPIFGADSQGNINEWNEAVSSNLTRNDLLKLMEMSLVPIFGTDSQGRINEWNEMAAKISGYRKTEVLGKDLVSKLVAYDYKKYVIEAIDKVMVDEAPVEFTLPFYSRHGKPFSMLMRFNPRCDAEGNISGMIGVALDVTDTSKARAETQRTAKELAQFIETANAPIFGIDSQGRVDEWNLRAAKITGYTKKEVLGKDLVAEYITEEYKKPVREVLDNALSGEETANYEFPLYTKTGLRVDVLLNATTRRDADGKIVGVIGVGQDITEANKAWAESKRTADELTQFVDSANAPIFGIDSQGRVNEWNQRAAKITGYTKKEVLGKDLVAEYITEEYKTPVREVLDNALSGEETANYEFPLYTKTGLRVDVLLNATTRRDADGKIVGVIGVGQDITEANKAWAESKRTADELTQFVDSANAPIFGIDSQGRVNEWNQRAAKITGYTKKEVLGKDLVAEYITEEYKTPVRMVLENALSGIETANYEFPLYTKTGLRVDVLLNATTRRDADGKTVGVIGVGQDITELRQKQKALTQSQKMETVGQLTGGIAHDFNNLLSVIGGNLRFLRQDIGGVTPDIEELFEDAMSATKDGADLTARLLAFSRNRILKPELKEVNETIDHFTRFLSRTLGNNIDLITDLSKSKLFINVDTSQLENALLNLAINSRDAMPDGGRITIRSSTLHHNKMLDAIVDSDINNVTLDSGEYVVVTLTDTGSGISDKDLTHVYEPFFTTKDVGKGSGLGLSMIYGFIQQSSGACHIQSQIGVGTEFSMYFPKVNQLPFSASSNRENEKIVTGSEVILVVEDEPRVRRVTLRDLNKLGYRTLEAENATIAKEIIGSGERIDLVFSDVLMPGKIDGKMLGLWVEEKHPDIKIILTSGYSKSKSDTEDRESHLPLIRKPYTIEKLANSIRGALG